MQLNEIRASVRLMHLGKCTILDTQIVIDKLATILGCNAFYTTHETQVRHTGEEAGHLYTPSEAERIRQKGYLQCMRDYKIQPFETQEDENNVTS